MAERLNSTHRIKVIYDCLQKGDKWTTKDFIAAIREADGGSAEFSDRTIKGDIKKFNEVYTPYANLPQGETVLLKFNPKLQTYFLTDQNFKLNRENLSTQEQKLLEDAIELIGSYDQLAYLQEFKGVIKRIQGAVQESAREGAPMIKIDQLPSPKGIEYFDELLQCIKAKKCIGLWYQPFNKPNTDNKKFKIISPYQLKEYNNRWFLLGKEEEEAGVSIFGLDRIHKIQSVLNTFVEIEEGLLEKYFKDIIGVSVPTGEKEKVETVMLRFAKARGKYVQAKPIHQSQTLIKEDDQYLYFQLKLMLNRELITWILSFGKECCVLKPARLITKVHKEIKGMLEVYSLPG